jgi:predicted GTPase
MKDESESYIDEFHQWTDQKSILMDDVDVIDLPVKWMNHVAIVDTPGTNAIIQRHEKLTSTFIPRADFILFITSAERPLTESEAVFLEKIKLWGKKVIVVVNKIDILQNESEREEVLAFVTRNSSNILNRITPVPGSNSLH